MKATIFAVVALLLTLASAKDMKCEEAVYDPKTGQSYYFDLSRLHHDNRTYVDSLWYRTDENQIYYVNFCGQTAASCSDDCSVCLRVFDGQGDYKYICAGRTSTQKISIAEAPGKSPADSVTVSYSDGEQCGSGRFSTKIYVNCLDSATPGFIYDINETDRCAVTLYMYSASGCAQAASSSGSSTSSAGPVPGEFCEAVMTKDGASYLFDLRPLNHPSSQYVDTLWYRTPENLIYYVNFCGQTAAPCNDNDTSVCLRMYDGGDYKYINVGSTSTQEFSVTPGLTFGKSITVTYSDGAKCGMGTAKTNLVVNCQDGATPGFFYDLKEINECESTLYMYSSAGCGVPVSPSSSSSDHHH